MEKGKFNQSWKNAFDDAEVAPSDSVWTNVELTLEKAAGGKMKQRLLFYKLLAAASLVFALGIAGVYYYRSVDESTPSALALQESPDHQVAESEVSSTHSATEAQATTDARSLQATPPVEPAARHDERLVEHKPAVKKESNLNGQPTLQQSSSSVLVATLEKDGEAVPVRSAYFENLLGPPRSVLASFTRPALAFAEVQPELEPTADPGMVLLAQLRDEEKKYQEKEKKSATEKIWTSVGVGAGSFNPYTSHSTAMQGSSGFGNNQAFISNPTSGSSYSVGVQVGGRIANRLVILGGISYLTQNAGYTSNLASMEATAMKATLNDHAFSGSNQAVATSPYGINSNLQYVSLPVQAGYVVVDRKFSIQLNGGIATDFFMMNTLTPDADYVDKVSQGPGDDSPYRPVTFNGLVGTEFSYRVSDRYRVAINPGVRYALNSIYKADVYTEVAPITYDVSLRFRYIFK